MTTRTDLALAAVASLFLLSGAAYALTPPKPFAVPSRPGAHRRKGLVTGN